MIVVDVGCASYAEEESLIRLTERFHPSVIYGFDPNQEPGVSMRGDTMWCLSDYAAWTEDGTVSWTPDGIRSRTGEEDAVHTARCVDLARVVRDSFFPVVIKIDIEGGEYRLIKHLIDQDVFATQHVPLMLVEWHGEPYEPIPCPVEPWTAHA